VEVYKDSALALPPLNSTLALRLMEQTQIFKALKGVRGRKPVDLIALQRLLVRFSQLVIEQPAIAEVDINPLIASPERLLALDARVVLHDPSKQDQSPKPAIRPYPIQYASQFRLKDGRELVIRPIRPEDEPAMAEFHGTLSDRTVYLRYFASLSLSARIAHERLLRICFGDYEREIVLVAETANPQGARSIVGVGRLTRLGNSDQAEVAVLVADHYQNQGLGLELLRRLVHVARAEKITRVTYETLANNVSMHAISGKLGFKLRDSADSPSVSAVLDL
jgi:acetyltransferase